MGPSPAERLASGALRFDATDALSLYFNPEGVVGAMWLRGVELERAELLQAVIQWAEERLWEEEHPGEERLLADVVRECVEASPARDGVPEGGCEHCGQSWADLAIEAMSSHRCKVVADLGG